MIRPFFTELVLFLTPFVLYAVFLWATRARVIDPEGWSMNVLVGLTVSALVLMFVSFLVLAQFAGAPPGSTYIPAHLDHGKFIPGTTK